MEANMNHADPTTVRDPRWKSVVARDATQDGKFFYSVKTTGVYCRPSCAARPKPENVRFHATVVDAERAGFRPCKRCRPDRRPISFSIARTALGHTLVAETDKGLCAILFADDAGSLRRDLRARFPREILVEREKALPAAVLRLIDLRSGGEGLALDMRGSEFQTKVWHALRAIPSGTTASYADIAKRLGRPSAVRAVARACAANPLALAVPCHRVVKSDGSLSGYRWGVARKAKLLAREAAAS
jgi:AraC family transcriptional regulator of adaptative response/methylated-DNA-[protein]-cysteine methyltransferase